MQFADIPGHASLKSQLISAQQRGKISHAQLFAGSTGSVALPLALGYASYLMCEHKSENDSCGKCPSCLRIKKLIHPDIHFIFPKISPPDGKYEKVMGEAIPLFRSFISEKPFGSLAEWANFYGQENKNLLVSREDSRQILRNVSMRSVEGGYKILIIWCPELMNVSAANAILKILEEPPKKTLFLMITYNYEGLLTTITSRSLLINVPLNTDEEINQYLLEKGINEDSAKKASFISEGKIGYSLRSLSDEETEFKDFQLWMRECLGGNFTAMVTRSEEFHKLGKADQRARLYYFISLSRKALLSLSEAKPPFESEAEETFVTKFAKTIGSEKLEKIYMLLNEVGSHLDRNANAKIIHLNASLDLFQIINVTKG